MVLTDVWWTVPNWRVPNRLSTLGGSHSRGLDQPCRTWASVSQEWRVARGMMLYLPIPGRFRICECWTEVQPFRVWEGAAQPPPPHQQELESLCGLLSVEYAHHEVPRAVVLAGHGSAYGRHALLTSPAHRGVVQRHTSPGRSEVVGARDFAEARAGRPPSPRLGEQGGRVFATRWTDGLKCLHSKERRGSRSCRNTRLRKIVETG